MPPDASGSLPISSLISQLQAVDLVILAGILLYGLGGMRRGFVSGTLSVVGLFVTVAGALAATPFLAQAIRGAFPTLPIPETLLRVLAFVACLGIAQVLFSIVVRFVLGVVEPARRALGPFGLVERALGFLPGVVMGVILAALVITPLRLFPIFRPLSTALDDSVVAREISRLVGDWSPQLEGLLRNVAGNGVALPSRIIQPGENVAVPRTQDVQPDPEAEMRMLELVNGERVKAGLAPLVADDRLRDVARGHSQEMFRLGYFAHVSPTDGSPADRLKRAGVAFATAGENLAYAPTVEVAHSGLMASEGHRRNILTPEYTRVGIGVVRGGLYGRMFTQNFAG
jgi:uncharacterized protein YkwD/uncharacterized membrane protein required for colicin V production